MSLFIASAYCLVRINHLLDCGPVVGSSSIRAHDHTEPCREKQPSAAHGHRHDSENHQNQERQTQKAGKRKVTAIQRLDEGPDHDRNYP